MTRAPSSAGDSLLAELWKRGVWRVLPILFFYVTSERSDTAVGAHHGSYLTISADNDWVGYRLGHTIIISSFSQDLLSAASRESGFLCLGGGDAAFIDARLSSRDRQ